VVVAMAMRVTPQLAMRVTPRHWRIAACRWTFSVGCHLVRAYRLSASRRLWLGHGGGPRVVACVFLAALVRASWQARGPVGGGGARGDFGAASWRERGLRWRTGVRGYGTRVLGGVGVLCGVESCCGRVVGVGWFARCCSAALRCDDRLALAGWRAGVLLARTCVRGAL
jgi:hypothetical protein